jgi:hypothetical protein
MIQKLFLAKYNKNKLKRIRIQDRNNLKKFNLINKVLLLKIQFGKKSRALLKSIKSTRKDLDTCHLLLEESKNCNLRADKSQVIFLSLIKYWESQMKSRKKDQKQCGNHSQENLIQIFKIELNQVQS